MNLPKPFLYRAKKDKQASWYVDGVRQQWFRARRVLLLQLDQLQPLSFTGIV